MKKRKKEREREREREKNIKWQRKREAESIGESKQLTSSTPPPMQQRNSLGSLHSLWGPLGSL